MAVSFDAWRRAHGFSSSDAPESKELALRLLMEKGSISPELTEQMIGAISPELMNKLREVQQAQSVAPVPPEIEQILEQATQQPPATPEQTTPPNEVPPNA
jgi:hypothetical protein